MQKDPVLTARDQGFLAFCVFNLVTKVVAVGV